MTPEARESLRRTLGFLASGTAGFVLYCVFSMCLVRIPLGAGPAAFLASLLAVPPTFLLQKHLAFRHRGASLRPFLGYCALQAVNALLVGLLARAGQRAGLPDLPNFVASGAVVVVVSYLVLSRFVFRDPGASS
jgi:putative flippase GtrA